MSPAKFISRHSARHVVEEHRHRLLIASSAYPDALQDLSDTLEGFYIHPAKSMQGEAV